MTLAQWCEKHPKHYSKRFDRSAGDNWTFDLVVCTNATDAIELYRLTDRRVSSQNSGNSYHLVKPDSKGIQND